MEKKKSLSTILFGVALLLFVCAIFAMFGPVIKYGSAHFPNMFQAAFGTGGAYGIRTRGLTTIFVFQMIILAGIIAIIVGSVTHKFHYILMIVIYGIVCLCSLIALIMSFNALNLYRQSGQTVDPAATLGAGPIVFSVMHILGLLASTAGLVFSRRGK